MAAYTNPWFAKGRLDYGPAEYQTDATPKEYRGYLIYHRNSECWDIVKDGVCVAQRAGATGARRAVDSLIAVQAGTEFGVRNCGTCSRTFVCLDCDHDSQQALWDLSCSQHEMRAKAHGGAA